MNIRRAGVALKHERGAMACPPGRREMRARGAPGRPETGTGRSAPVQEEDHEVKKTDCPWAASPKNRFSASTVPATAHGSAGHSGCDSLWRANIAGEGCRNNPPVLSPMPGCRIVSPSMPPFLPSSPPEAGGGKAHNGKKRRISARHAR